MNNVFAVVVGIFLTGIALVAGAFLGAEAVLIFRAIFKPGNDTGASPPKPVGENFPEGGDTNPLGPRRSDMVKVRRRDTVRRMINFFEDE